MFFKGGSNHYGSSCSTKALKIIGFSIFHIKNFAENDQRVHMGDILKLANDSNIKECILMLDCCFSGKLGTVPAINNNSTIIREGLTILTASRPNQISMEGPIQARFSLIQTSFFIFC